MGEKNNGARRRKAFSDFKENQYDDSFSLNPSKKNNKTFRKVVKIILIVIITLVFIIIGFSFTDSLIKISEQPYADGRTYTASQIATTLPPAVTPKSEAQTQTAEQSSVSSQPSQDDTQTQTPEAENEYQNQAMENY